MTSPYIYILPLLLQQIWGISAFNNSSTLYYLNRSRLVKSSITQRILGGKVVQNIKQYPFMASLQSLVDMPVVHCGASIIHPLWALTAAQCLYDEYGNPLTVNEALVVTGLIDITKTDGSHVNFPEKLYPHEKYVPGEFVYDIGIILLEAPVKHVKFNEVPRLPYKLLMEWQEPADLFWSCKTMGWGYTSTSEILSDKLRVVEIPLMPNRDCYYMVMYDGYFDYTMVCTKNIRRPGDACGGDAGGPLMCDKYLIGIVSWGDVECKQSRIPGVYTRVDKYLSWIRKTLPDHVRSFSNQLKKVSVVFAFIEILIVVRV